MSDRVLDRVRKWAMSIDDVRAVVLTGSRAGDAACTDRFSDYDIILYLTTRATLTADTTWPSVFGPVLVDFRDVVEDTDGAYAMHLVLFEDGTKIDFALAPVERLRRLAPGERLPSMLDAGYRVILDKDGLTSSLASPSGTAHVPRRPTQRDFSDLVREFWWEATYVAKQLWREELLPAKYSLDSVIILVLLRRVLEWRLEIDRAWRFVPGDLGRGLDHHLDAATRAELTTLFVGPIVTDNWDALFRATRLFRKTATQVADALALSYPHDLDSRVTAYLESVRQLPRNAV